MALCAGAGTAHAACARRRVVALSESSDTEEEEPRRCCTTAFAAAARVVAPDGVARRVLDNIDCADKQDVVNESECSNDQEEQDPAVNVQRLPAGAEVRHASLGKGVLEKTARGDGRLLFQWKRMEPIGRGRKRRAVLLNRWVSPEELFTVDQNSVGSKAPPKRAAHHRERHQGQNSEATHRRSQYVGFKSRTVKNISSEAMIHKHFPNECLQADPIYKDKVFCRACKKSYQKIKSSVRAHVTTEKHKEAVTIYMQRLGEDSELKQYFQDYYKEHSGEVMASVSLEIQVLVLRI